MNPKTKLLIIAFILVGCFCIIFLGVSLLIFTDTKVVRSFDECAKKGVVIDTYPEQCIYDSKTFVRLISKDKAL